MSIDTPLDIERGTVNAAQHAYLLNRLKSNRIASRQMPGSRKQMSYLESWDVKAHLTRIFGFGNYDLITLREQLLHERPYTTTYTDKDTKKQVTKDMFEVSWQVTMLLVVRDPKGREICRFSEGAVGSATGGAASGQTGDLHDNALKSAASDAMKRCAINLGTQFGLSLYDNGNTQDVVRTSLVVPEGTEKAPTDAQAVATLEDKLGAQQVQPTGEGGNEGHVDETPEKMAALNEEVDGAPPSNGRPGSQHVAEGRVGDRLETERQAAAGEENQDPGPGEGERAHGADSDGAQ